MLTYIIHGLKIRKVTLVASDRYGFNITEEFIF